MPQMRGLKERVSDSEKWAKQLKEEEEASFWHPVPYSMRDKKYREIEDMEVKREMAKLEIVVLGKGDK